MTAPRDCGQGRLAIRFSDLDVAGHVNNVAWLRFVHIGVSRALASRPPPHRANQAGAERGPGEIAWRCADIRYRRAIQAVGTPITVRANPVEQTDGVLVVACEVGAVEPDGRVIDCVTAEIFLGPPAMTALEPDASSAHRGPKPAPPVPTDRWPWSMVVPVRATDRTDSGSLSPTAAADLLQEARHDALSSWRHGLRGRLIVARTVFGLSQATVRGEIRLDSRCSRVGRASVDLASCGVDPASGAVVVRSTTRIARLMTGTDPSATPWSDAERALLQDIRG
ncbi:hypothetical protein ABT061_29695 [Streptosporangium sp. NPDC002544]|uniref:hypothetical protein n=1 Tax=Streptosporangium sp. NPDC002544 TaxID=3154538 RepID=UPI0033223D4C